MVFCGVYASLSLLLAVVEQLCLGLFITRMHGRERVYGVFSVGVTRCVNLSLVNVYI